MGWPRTTAAGPCVPGSPTGPRPVGGVAGRGRAAGGRVAVPVAEAGPDLAPPDREPSGWCWPRVGWSSPGGSISSSDAAASDRASVGLVQVNSGSRRPGHRDDAHLAAVAETLRSGAPPFVVATYHTRTGELDVDPVTPELLAVAARRLVTGVGALHSPRRAVDPSTGTGAWCAGCAADPFSVASPVVPLSSGAVERIPAPPTPSRRWRRSPASRRHERARHRGHGPPRGRAAAPDRSGHTHAGLGTAGGRGGRRSRGPGRGGSSGDHPVVAPPVPVPSRGSSGWRNRRSPGSPPS